MRTINMKMSLNQYIGTVLLLASITLILFFAVPNLAGASDWDSCTHMYISSDTRDYLNVSQFCRSLRNWGLTYMLAGIVLGVIGGGFILVKSNDPLKIRI